MMIFFVLFSSFRRLQAENTLKSNLVQACPQRFRVRHIQADARGFLATVRDSSGLRRRSCDLKDIPGSTLRETNHSLPEEWDGELKCDEDALNGSP